MRSFIAAFLASIVVAAVLTPVVLRIAKRIGAVSVPGGRHVHGQPTPRLGGVAICLAFVTPLITLFLTESSVASIVLRERSRAVGLLVGAVGMCGLGVADDARGLRARTKLAFQLVAAVFAFQCGFRIDGISLPLIGTHSMGVFALPVTVVWIVGVINAVNLIDGLDGLAAGVVFFAALTNFVVASITGAVFVALVSAAVLGSVVGFLFYNFNPAKIFMGDSGSYFLGYSLAVSSLAGASQKTSTAVALLVPLVALGVPVLDTLLAIVRRMFDRRSIFSADRGHIHHRLLDMGVTHRRAVLVIYSFCVLFAASSITISLGTTWQVGLAMLSSTVILVGIVRFLGYFQIAHVRVRQANALRSRHCELLRRAMPEIVARFGATKTEEEIWQALGAVAALTELTSVHVVRRENDARPDPSSPARYEYQWAGQPLSLREATVATFSIGADACARGDVTFRWGGEDAENCLQTQILLQVLADVVALALTRSRSRVAPAPEEVYEAAVTRESERVEARLSEL